MPMPPWFHDPALVALADAHPTPFYAHHGPTLDAAAAQLRTLRSVDRIFYAQKANDTAQVLARLTGHGFGLECVSGGELAAADGLPAPLLFTPNFAPRAEYADAFARGAHVTLDGLHPLARWPELFRGRDVLLRFDLGVGRGHHRHVRTSGGDAKFGLAPEDLPAARDLAAAAGARIVGLHTHSGSGIFDAATWAEHLEALQPLASALPDVRIFNLGGGLGVPYGRGRPLDLAAVDAALAEARARVARARTATEVWLEPGRFLVCEAGVLVLRVTQIKDKYGRRFVGVDGGMNALIRPALYGARHPVVSLTRPGAPPVGRVTLVGPCCESADVLARNVALPEIEEGDLLALTHAGAYGFTMASRYNRREVGEVFIPG